MTKKQVLDRLVKFSNCRVKCSAIHGVGLHATRDISAGTSIFGEFRSEVRYFFTHLNLKRILPIETLEMIYDYNVITDTGVILPDYAENYHHLASYLNHSEDSNVDLKMDTGEFIASRLIMGGEEIFCNFLNRENLDNGKYKLKFLE